MTTAASDLRAVLIASRELAPGVRHFEFEVPGVKYLDFAAGQFVSLSHVIGDRHITRAYSIASAPDGTNRFSLCLNLVPDGLFSPFLFRLAPGESVAMQGPLGTFTLREPLAREMVWVATGTGIAPFRAMLDVWRSLDAGERGRVTLVFGARYQAGLLYHDDFVQAAAEEPAGDFDYRPTLSRPPEGWTGRTGHVQAHVLEAIGGRRELNIYICGLKAMVDDLRTRLKAMGFDRKQIIYEKFD